MHPDQYSRHDEISMHSPKAVWQQWQQNQSPASSSHGHGHDMRQTAQQMSATSEARPLSLDARIATANIQNPADAVAALHILAEVTGEDAERTQQLTQARLRENEGRKETVTNDLDFPPVRKGALSLQNVIGLLDQYVPSRQLLKKH